MDRRETGKIVESDSRDETKEFYPRSERTRQLYLAVKK
jgi:hypothetical protein